MNTELESAIDRRSAELYSDDEWQVGLAQFEKIGLSTELYDMRCHVLETVFEESPDLFEGIDWMNDDNGMPLWVRPGVKWIPDFQLEDDD
jgi:hypothetical protein